MTGEICGCGHLVSAHTANGCTEWRCYPEVLHARQCGCTRPWKADDA